MVRLVLAALLCAALVAGCASLACADTYTNTFANASGKPWIAWHVDCANATPDFYTVPPDIYKVGSPGVKWIIYPFEQGSNYYQRNGFLAYPPDGSGMEIGPGEQLSVTFDYTTTGGASFDQYPVDWPLDGTTVTVTPENMRGWSIATNQGARANIVTYGPGVWEANRALVAEEQNIHLGRGSFYAELDYAGGPGSPDTPASAWLGLDTFNGQPLAGVSLDRITTLKYFAFNGKIPTRTNYTPPDWEHWSQYWIYPRDPICLELTVEDPNDPTERRQFWFRPWQTSKVSGDNCGRQAKRWLWYDCINGTPQVQVTTRWYCYRGLAPDGVTSLDEVYASWADLVAAYGEWKLVETSNDPYPTGFKSAGWDETTDPIGSPTYTATGKCLNFEVGARKGYTHIYGPDNNFQLNVVNWAGYYWGLRGNLDLFTLGVDGQEVTYDFEPSQTEPGVRKASTNQKSTYDAAFGTAYLQQNYEIRNHSDVWDHYPTMVFGRVTRINNVCFSVHDGSAMSWPIRVYVVRNLYNYYQAPRYFFPATGEYWCVSGWLEKPRFGTGLPKPYCVWTSIFNCKRVL